MLDRQVYLRLLTDDEEDDSVLSGKKELMRRYEYMSLGVVELDHHDLVELNRLGIEGWQVVGSNNQVGYGCKVILMREIPPTPYFPPHMTNRHEPYSLGTK